MPLISQKLSLPEQGSKNRIKMYRAFSNPHKQLFSFISSAYNLIIINFIEIEKMRECKLGTWKEFSFDAQIQTMYGGACVGMSSPYWSTYQANIKCGSYSIPQAYTDCTLGAECSEVAGSYISGIWGIPDRSLGSNSWTLKKVGIYCVKIDLVSEDECLKGVNLSYPPTGESWYSFDC